MTEVLLSDYLAHLFAQISRARDMADRYSKEIALEYAKDDVLRHFSVPRFKLSKVDLTIPVLVSGVHVSSLMQFQVNRDDFRSFIIGKAIDVVVLVRGVKRGTRTNPDVRTDGIEPLFDRFYQQLAADPSRWESIIKGNWPEIVAKVLAINGVPDEPAKRQAVAEILARTQQELIEAARAHVSVSKATIERLLINPETHVVKDGSNDTSVFTIKAELMEEGVLIKRVKDERTGTESTVVEFE